MGSWPCFVDLEGCRLSCVGVVLCSGSHTVLPVRKSKWKKKRSWEKKKQASKKNKDQCVKIVAKTKYHGVDVRVTFITLS